MLKMKFFIKPKSHRVIQTVRLDGDKWVAQEKFWGSIDTNEIDSEQISIFKDCKSIEEIQNKLEEKLKTIKDCKENPRPDIWKYIDGKDVYDVSELANLIEVDVGDLCIFQSRGGSSIEFLHQNNVFDEELSKEISIEDFGEETSISLRQAMIDGRDDIIQNDFDYGWEEDEYYQAPLTVVEVK